MYPSSHTHTHTHTHTHAHTHTVLLPWILTRASNMDSSAAKNSPKQTQYYLWSDSCLQETAAVWGNDWSFFVRLFICELVRTERGQFTRISTRSFHSLFWSVFWPLLGRPVSVCLFVCLFVGPSTSETFIKRHCDSASVLCVKEAQQNNL